MVIEHHRKNLLGTNRRRPAERKSRVSGPAYHSTHKYYQCGCRLRPDTKDLHEKREQNETHANTEKVRCGELQKFGDDGPSPHIGPEGHIFVEEIGIGDGKHIAQNHRRHVGCVPSGKGAHEQHVQGHEYKVAKDGVPDADKDEFNLYPVTREQTPEEAVMQGFARRVYVCLRPAFTVRRQSRPFQPQYSSAVP